MGKIIENYKDGFNTVKDRLIQDAYRDSIGCEHDFADINSVTKKQKAIKIERFRDVILPELGKVVELVEEVNTNCWRVTTNNGRRFMYYSTSFKIKELGRVSAKMFKVHNNGIVKFFSKDEFNNKK